MRKNFVLLILLALLSLNALAQTDNRANSNFGFSIEGGLSHLFLGKDLNPFEGYTTPTYGYGGGATFFYELQYKHFLFRTGFGVDYTFNFSKFQSPNYTVGIAEYPSMRYHYDFHEFKEKTMYGIGYVPVYFGGLFNRFFFLVGAKIGVLPFLSFTQASTNATIWATDEDAIDPMQDIYTHEMKDYSFTGPRIPIEFNRLNIMGSLEFGINLDKSAWQKKDKSKTKTDRAQQYRELHRRKSFKERQHYRLSIFADFGVTNMLAYKANPVPDPTTGEAEGGLYAISGVSDITPGSVYGYAPHRNAFLNNTMVGIKFAMMCEVPHKAPKKGSMANPYIVTFVTDELTGKPLGGAKVKTQTVPKGKGKPRITEKETDAKRGRTSRSYPPGDYIISVTRPGYFPQEPFNYAHEDDYDTLYIALYPQHTLRAEAVDAKTGRAVKAQITLKDGTGKQLASANVDSVSRTFSTIVDDRQELTVCVKAEGYRDTCFVVENVNDVLNLQLEPRHIRRFVLKNLLFATDKTRILQSSRPALNELYRMLRDNPDIRIRIVGHTDDVGRDDYNQKLSEGRAYSVKKEMVNRGISAKRIETVGRGEKDPIVPNDSEKHRQMNRRVEIEILGGASIDTFIQTEGTR